MVYTCSVVIKQTEKFAKWLKKIKNNFAKAVIARRIERLENGNFGDSKCVGDNVFELRFDIGSGYRIYFMNEGSEIIILLLGGNKSSQRSDIQHAKKIAKEIRSELWKK